MAELVIKLGKGHTKLIDTNDQREPKGSNVRWKVGR
jgi:hypothetical protein